MTLSEAIAGVLGGKKRPRAQEELGDFTTTVEVIPISFLAIGIGIFSAFVALALLRLIGIFTNLFFYQRWGTALVSPAGNHLDGWRSSCRWPAVSSSDSWHATARSVFAVMEFRKP